MFYYISGENKPSYNSATTNNKNSHLVTQLEIFIHHETQLADINFSKAWRKGKFGRESKSPESIVWSGYG